MSDSALYAILPAKVRYDKELTPIAKLLYAEITASLNVHGASKDSDEHFAKMLNTDIGEINKALYALDSNGYIEIDFTASTDDQLEHRIISIRRL